MLYFINPFGTFEHFARLGAVGGTDDAVAFHKVDEVGGASVADAQASLQQGSGGFAEVKHETHGIFVKLVGIVFAAFCSKFALGGLFFSGLEEFLLVLRETLRAPELDDRRDFLFGHEWSMYALHTR